MKISELAEASGETIPTIKFYIRERLLPPGESVARTQARYDAWLLLRMDLIRSLRVELGMSVEKFREVLLEANNGGEAMLAAGLRGANQSRHGAPKQDASSPEMGKAWQLLSTLERDLNWEVHPDDLSAGDVAEAVATILRAMPDSGIEESLIEYARVMKDVADAEIPESFDPAGDPWESLRYAVLGTYLFEPLILALRRMAHGQRTAELMRGRSPHATGPSTPKPRKKTPLGA
jgi:DNA-binding transcriptional MerR regulator